MNFYVIGIIALVFIAIVAIIALQVSKKTAEKDQAIKQDIVSILEKFGKYDENHLYPKFTFNEVTYSVALLKVKDGTKLTFNSKTIWEKKLGESKIFLDQKVFAAVPGRKIVIIYPHSGPFMYHYDENEIRFTKPKERFWDMQVIAYNNLEEALQEGL